MLLSENDLLWSALVLKTTLHEQYPKEPQRSGLQPPAWHAANKLFTGFTYFRKFISPGFRTSEHLSRPACVLQKIYLQAQNTENAI